MYNYTVQGHLKVKYNPLFLGDIVTDTNKYLVVTINCTYCLLTMG